MDGVSTYLALTFGTLLSSQGTDASFVLTPPGFPPGASLRSCVSDSIRSFRSDFLGAFRGPASAFPFPADPTLSEVSGRIDRPSFPTHREGASSKSVSREADRCHCRLQGQTPSPGNCSNLPPHSFRVNGSRGAKRRLAAERTAVHIRPPSGSWHCARLPPGRRSPRRAPHVRPGRRRRPGRPARQRLRW